eukprot:TRINITY_DN906_c0_g1_i3.p2 TRINITY_DN906_c0_g1~~TRINITY_DN906_c0_g1_i3.p2  ORF type:complete len:103 (-),score=21.21 TRINITY_DN906_c0_g1_i3:462-770(-)
MAEGGGEGSGEEDKKVQLAKVAGIVLALGIGWSILRPKKKVVVDDVVDTEESEDAGDKSITVGEGDTLYSISKKYDVSVDDLKSVNALSSDTIVLGSELRIP